MNWNLLESADQIQTLIEESFEQPVIIFKHSTRCSISRASLDRLERNWKETELPAHKIYFLDLLAHRNISNDVAETFQVEHESPQVILIQQGKAVYAKSHFEIDYINIKNALRAVPQKTVH